MIEADWLACTDPQAMLQFLRGKASDRKLRLFAVACCRRISNLLDTRGLMALDIAEQFAEGLMSAEQLRDAARLAEDAFNEFSHVREYAAEAVIAACDQDALAENTCRAAWFTIQLVDVGVSRPLIKATRRLTQRQECQWLRDMFNPFRSCTLDPSLLTRTITGLAETIYCERDFSGLPILADALEDAGCQDAAILDHCRQPGQHVRGCWVVDLLTGRGAIT